MEKIEYSQKMVENLPLMIYNSGKNLHKPRNLQSTKKGRVRWWAVMIAGGPRLIWGDRRWLEMIWLTKMIAEGLPMLGRWLRRWSTVGMEEISAEKPEDLCCCMLQTVTETKECTEEPVVKVLICTWAPQLIWWQIWRSRWMHRSSMQLMEVVS